MTADLPQELMGKDMRVIPMSYVLDGVVYDGKTRPFLTPHEFYSALEAGKSASTSMVPVSEAADFFRDMLKEGKDVLHISFPAAMSGCYNGYLKAAELALADYPERRIVVIDGKSARKISSFASTSGPAFVLGTVGGVLFDSAAVGALLLAAHFLSALAVGVLFRGRRVDRTPRKKRARKSAISDRSKNTGGEYARDGATAKDGGLQKSPARTARRATVQTLDTDAALGDSIRSSTLAMLAVGGYVVLGNMLVDALSLTGIESVLRAQLPAQAAQAILAFVFGAVEMTRGCLTAADVSSLPLAAATASACISFGGLSVMLQSHAFLSRCGIRLPSILLRKSVQAAVSYGTTYLIFLCFQQFLT